MSACTLEFKKIQGATKNTEKHLKHKTESSPTIIFHFEK